ncbi:protein FRA10AC1 homolog [Aplysia californica]|uniref:Protein FRA10AC1 homolog n=1 Tax=Aplysia californica TaxID=6500 RepID=A0ABM0K889_APLCA|nr:protein FRA10AC1 homolog [Aplysia californica]
MVDRIDFSQVPKDRGYDSAFDSDLEVKEKRDSFRGLLKEKKKKDKVAHKRQLEDELIKEEGKIYRTKAVALDAFSRHKEYINNYLLYYGGSKKEFERDRSKDKTDLDVIREHHQFLWDEDPDEKSWEKTLAKKYYDKLFKEYCIADLSRYKENKVGMRWRIEKEVIDGKGQFVCGNKKCSESEGLRSWEVNFGYLEHGEKKNALVKLRLCPDCSYKLNYHHKRKEVLPKSKKSRSAHSSLDAGSKKQKMSDSGGAGSSKDYVDEEGEIKRGEKKGAVEGEDGQEEGVWSKPVKLVEEKSREDEYDDYFADMFL